MALIPAAAAMCAPGCASTVAAGVGTLLGGASITAAAPVLAAGAGAYGVYSYLTKNGNKTGGENDENKTEEEGENGTEGGTVSSSSTNSTNTGTEDGSITRTITKRGGIKIQKHRGVGVRLHSDSKSSDSESSPDKPHSPDSVSTCESDNSKYIGLDEFVDADEEMVASGSTV